MIEITEYIKLSKSKRQEHLRLNEPCVDRGASYSTLLKGLLAHILDTTIPIGVDVSICHACHNGRCSNPYHIYWGTTKENIADAYSNGKKTIWEYQVAKYGLVEAKRRIAESNKKQRKGSKGNPGEPKPADQKAKISASIKLLYQQGVYDTKDKRKIGEWNSQYNTCWITKDGKNTKVKAKELEIYLSRGWKRGRVLVKKFPLRSIGRTVGSEPTNWSSNL